MPDFQPIAGVTKDRLVWLYDLHGAEHAGRLCFWGAAERDWFESDSAAFGLLESRWPIPHCAEFVAPT